MKFSPFISIPYIVYYLKESSSLINIYIYLKFKALRALLSSLRGRFAPIFLISCEHVLFVYIVKQNKNNSRIFTKKLADFQNLQKFNDDRISMETNI